MLTTRTAVMLVIAKSPLSLVAQLMFVALNIVGTICSVVYNANTPNLYPRQYHYSWGWLLTCVVVIQGSLGIITVYQRSRTALSEDCIPTPKVTSTEDVAFRYLDNSAERDTELPRSESSDTLSSIEQFRHLEISTMWSTTWRDRMSHVCSLFYEAINRMLLPLGFIGFQTGVATYIGVFVRSFHFSTTRC